MRLLRADVSVSQSLCNNLKNVLCEIGVENYATTITVATAQVQRERGGEWKKSGDKVLECVFIMVCAISRVWTFHVMIFLFAITAIYSVALKIHSIALHRWFCAVANFSLERGSVFLLRRFLNQFICTVSGH